LYDTAASDQEEKPAVKLHMVSCQKGVAYRAAKGHPLFSSFKGKVKGGHHTDSSVVGMKDAVLHQAAGTRAGKTAGVEHSRGPIIAEFLRAAVEKLVRDQTVFGLEGKVYASIGKVKEIQTLILDAGGVKPGLVF